ncbi:MAG TPA: hypothetical protein VG498_14430 [Terriglobales bacterium]|nr:hypothetical protein [Terriglobales bacterium]
MQDRIQSRVSLEFPARFFAEFLDLLRFLIIEVSELILRVAMDPEQFIQLGVNRLGVPVFGSLDEERHQQSCHYGYAVPPKACGIKADPKYCVKEYDSDDPRAR